MASAALESLIAAIAEVEHLLAAARMPRGSTLAERASRERVIGRAGVVLLSSHYERYIYALNEEAVAFMNHCRPPSDSIPVAARLLHSRVPVDSMLETDWLKREDALTHFASHESWLWSTGESGSLSHERLLGWMKSPKPESLVRYFKYWGIDHIFKAVTRKESARGLLILRVKELVDKRNNIAHGNSEETATPADVRRYSATVLSLCRRADKRLHQALQAITGQKPPW